MRRIPLMAMLLAGGSASDHDVHAQTPPPFPFQYTAEFMCGRSPSRGAPQVLARGTYFTTINVHNPLAEKVELRKKFAIPRPDDEPKDESVVSRFSTDSLSADGAIEITCGDITRLLEDVLGTQTQIARLFIRGFVAIESTTELDVVAVYSTDAPSGFFSNRSMALDVEHVPARRLGQPDLIAVPDGSGSFCRRDSGGRLIITVQNAGVADAASSVTRLDFSGSGSLTVATPAVPGALSGDVLAPIPASCFSRDCTFRIAVDSTAIVSESNEGNDAAGGTCSG